MAPPKFSLDWKRFYAAEREAVLPPTLDFWLDLDAPPLPESGFLLFPHTRLLQSVEQIVPAVLSVLYSRAEEVLALGPLHGGRVSDKAKVSLARAGDPFALREFRAIHSGDSELAEEEFCLDTFEFLLREFSRRLERMPPRIHRRHPFLTLTGDPDPSTLPGYRRLASMVHAGLPIVATGDLIHYGAGYYTDTAPRSVDWARTEIERHLQFLGDNDLAGFQAHANAIKSDFRDIGPVLRSLFPGRWTHDLHSVAVIPYDDVLNSPAPTVVAAALVSIQSSSPASTAGLAD